MGKKQKLIFEGQEFNGYELLLAYFHHKYPQPFPMNARALAARVLKWSQDNRISSANIEVPFELMVSRKSQNAIEYRGLVYSGPNDFFDNVNQNPDLKFKNFFNKFSDWKKIFPDEKLTDEILDDLLVKSRMVTSDGAHVSEMRYFWEQLPKPKVAWQTFANKVAQNKTQFSRDEIPVDELKIMARPEREWLNDLGSDEFRDANTKRQITRAQFYEKLKEPKVDFGTWSQRLRKHKQRTKKAVSVSEAIELSQVWGVVDRAVGILYRWTNLENGKIYIGITTETLDERIRGHLRTAQATKLKKGSLHYDLRKHGLDVFNIEEIGRFDDMKSLADAEHASIILHNSYAPRGYNQVEGGRGVSLRKVPINYHGKTYKNLTSLADDYGMPVKRLEGRLRLGWGLEDALTLDANTSLIPTLSDKLSAPVSELAKMHGISTSKIYSRLAAGWTENQAVEIDPRPDNRAGKNPISIPVEVRGKMYPSIAKFAEAYGLTRKIVENRRKKGMTFEQIADEAGRKVN